MTTWAQGSSTSITAAIAAVGAGGTLTGGWIDLSGSVWSGANVAADTNTADFYLTSTQQAKPWNTGALYRPSSEDAITQRVTTQVCLNSGQTCYSMLRANRSTTAFNGYLVGIDNNSSGFFIHAFAVSGGTLKQIVASVSGSTTLSPKPKNGDIITLDVQAIQLTTTTSQLLISATNSTGTVIGSYDSTTDSASGAANVNLAAIQNVAGSTGLCAYSITGDALAGVKSVITYAQSSGSQSATKYSVAPASSTVSTGGTVQVVFTLDAASATDVTITPGDGGAGGSWNAATLKIAAGSLSGNLTYTAPSTAKTVTLTGTNGGSLTNGTATLTVQASVATATTYTITGPSAVTVGTGATYTIKPDAAPSADVVVTLSDNVGMGAFNPGTITLPAGSAAAQTFIYLARTAGTKSLTATNNGSLTNPAALTVQASVATTAITVDNPAFLFSPGNWHGDTGRGGSSWRRTWNVGAYFVFTFNASSSPTLTIDTTGSGNVGKANIYVNGVVQNASIGGVITVSGLVASASNTVFMIFTSTSQNARWNNGSNNLVVNGAAIDTASTAGVSAGGSKGWVQIIGDSITEGIEANGGSADITYCYSFSVLMALRSAGYEVSVSACGYSGYLVPGDQTKDVPPYYPISGTSRWGLIDQGVSQLDSIGHLSSYGATGTEPVGIAVNYLTNEALNTQGGNWTTSDSQTAMFNAMVANRAAAPNAWLFLIVPFGFHYPTKYPAQWLACFNAAISQYQSAYPTDKKILVVDIGSDLSNMVQANKNWLINNDDVHPLALGHSIISPVVSGAIVGALEGKRGRSFVYRAAS